MTAVQSPLRRLENLWSSVTAFRHVFTDAKQAHAACCDCIWLVLDGILLRVFQRAVIKHSFNPYHVFFLMIPSVIFTYFVLPWDSKRLVCLLIPRVISPVSLRSERRDQVYSLCRAFFAPCQLHISVTPGINMQTDTNETVG